jgi:type II secretory pathway pseudopilin PulG
MEGRPKTCGFTIVETMIVLAITSALFISVAGLLSGRENSTQFDQGVQAAQADIQQVINDVSSGLYADTNNFVCAAEPSGPVLSSAGSSDQGGNTGCIFLGKVLQFATSGTHSEGFRIFTVAGLQRDASGEDVSTYAAAVPTAVSPTPTAPNLPNATTVGNFEYGITVSEVYYYATASSSKTDIGAVAFVNSLASYTSGGMPVSSASQVNVIPIDPLDGMTLGATQQETAAAIDQNLATSPVNPYSVNICLVSGGTNQSGLVTIGSNGRELAATLSIKEDNTCS